MRITLILTTAVALFLAVVGAAAAQTPEPTPEPPVETPTPSVHLVQEGETLFTIAEQYETTVETLQRLNNIDDPSLIYVGQQINLPGGLGEAVTALHTIQLGDTLQGIAAAYKSGESDIAALNNLVKGDNLLVGSSLVITSGTGSAEPKPDAGTALLVKPGDTLLTLAAQYDLSPSAIINSNNLSVPTYFFPGQRLKIPSEAEYRPLAGEWQRLDLVPALLSQGSSAAIYVENSADDFAPTGRFLDQELHFVEFGNGYLALIGVDAFTEPGVYPLELDGSSSETDYSQNTLVASSGFGLQSITIPPEKEFLLEPEIRQSEDAFLATIFSSFETTGYWDEPYITPITNTFVTAGYGDARSYNDGPVEIYHTGVDFSGGIGTQIFAPAPGEVVLSDTLTLRGNSLILDHGLGVMTGYYHLSRILVEEGETVAAGQLVAEGGSTGLSTGPHLHWDLRIHNVPVDPMPWTAFELHEEWSRLMADE